mmetsp:Transcript_15153/g.24517  ORF Transcript_15153/g.24517 Transcript_15153/m.24517 type:complete len:142 (-) Transcript_15153:529-954(-)
MSYRTALLSISVVIGSDRLQGNIIFLTREKQTRTGDDDTATSLAVRREFGPLPPPYDFAAASYPPRTECHGSATTMIHGMDDLSSLQSNGAPHPIAACLRCLQLNYNVLRSLGNGQANLEYESLLSGWHLSGTNWRYNGSC